MAATEYRFLPWTRRGLAGHIATSGAELPGRAKVEAGLTISSIDEVARELHLYGPGDVVGVDPRMIVRTSPRAGSGDVEPNYFAHIEFDPPDFPWLFTPAAPGTNDRLPPWCVLVVVDLEAVEAPRTERGRPLPAITVPREAAAVELPDLDESWAWAHAQAVAPDDAADLAADLSDKPALNVSRIVAPRRLEAAKHYAACLVPAFDAGVIRGLGGMPQGDTLAPAWGNGADADVTLPVYFHWEFRTGARGDFESLARRLKPFRAPADLGVQPMYIGDAGPELPAPAPEEPGATLEMDGALRSPGRDPGLLDEVPQDVREALRTTLDALATLHDHGPGSEAPAFGPPVYGAFHAQQHTIPDQGPGWLRDLNLDPRARAAAGLGAEIERAHQEQLMHWCWEQVERILEANQLTSRARLSLEVLAHLHARFAALEPDRLFALAAPLHSRTRQGEATMSATIARSSLTDAGGDPALRRLTSPGRPVLRAALERAGAAAPPRSPRVRVVAGLAEGALDVDPTRFVPDGVQSVRALTEAQVPDSGDEPVALANTGLEVTAPASLLRDLRGDAEAAASQPAPDVVARPDLATRGVLTGAHLAGALEVLAQEGTLGHGLHATLGTIGAAGVSSDVTAIELGVAEGGQAIVAQPLSGTRPSTRPTVQPSPVRPDATPRPIRPIGPITPAAPIPPVKLPVPVRDPATVRLLEHAIQKAAPDGRLGSVGPERRFVPYDIESAGEVLLARTDPRATIPLRLSTMISVAGERGPLENPPSGIAVAPGRDRIMAAPALDVPVYEYLAELDVERLLPSAGEIPEDAITLLETNPRFVESLLVGLNHEMNRELLWREFPTDQRGTPLRSFWRWTDGNPDVEPIHTWLEGSSLGENTRGGPGGQVTLLVRGRLLYRYPNTTIYAWRSTPGGTLVEPPGANDLMLPAFAGVLGSDIAFVGFDLDADRLTEGDGWFLVLQEQPTEPRFGLDEPDRADGPTDGIGSWSEATWEHVGTAPGRYLSIEGNPMGGHEIGDVSFVDDAAHLAAISLQKPFRVAVHARRLLEEAPDA